MRHLPSQMVEAHLCPSAYIVLAVVLLPCSGVGWTSWDEGGTFQFLLYSNNGRDEPGSHLQIFFFFEPVYRDRGWCGAEKGER